jgi:hypothetical protein
VPITYGFVSACSYCRASSMQVFTREIDVLQIHFFLFFAGQGNRGLCYRGSYNSSFLAHILGVMCLAHKLPFLQSSDTSVPRSLPISSQVYTLYLPRCPRVYIVSFPTYSTRSFRLPNSSHLCRHTLCYCTRLSSSLPVGSSARPPRYSLDTSFLDFSPCISKWLG